MFAETAKMFSGLFKGHTDSVFSVVFSSHWDTKTGQICKSQIRSHKEVVDSVASAATVVWHWPIGRTEVGCAFQANPGIFYGFCTRIAKAYVISIHRSFVVHILPALISADLCTAHLGNSAILPI
jgi:hypothetical protein